MIEPKEAVKLGSHVTIQELKTAFNIFRADVEYWIDKPDIQESDAVLFALNCVFHAGIVQGKREERAKRRKDV